MPTPAEETILMNNTGPSVGLAATFDRRWINTAVIPAATGVIGMTAIWLPGGMRITNITVISGSTAAGTNTQFWVALYQQNLTLMAQSTSDTSGTTPTANTKVTKALTAVQTAPYTGMYYIAVSQSATTVATLLGASGPAANIANSDTPLPAGTTGSGVGATATNPAAALTAQIFSVYAYVT